MKIIPIPAPIPAPVPPPRRTRGLYRPRAKRPRILRPLPPHSPYDNLNFGDGWDRQIIIELNQRKIAKVASLAWFLAKEFCKERQRRREVWLYISRQIGRLIRLHVIIRMGRYHCCLRSELDTNPEPYDRVLRERFPGLLRELKRRAEDEKLAACAWQSEFRQPALQTR